MGIYKKLAEIQKQLIAPKGQFNAFGKYSYRSCEDILKALKPLCEEQNCVVFLNNRLVCIGDRNYVEATATLCDLDAEESFIESTAHAREEEVKKGMDGSQITGAASSYARKYALAGLFCIDNESDSDATNTHGKSNVQKVKSKPEETKQTLNVNEIKKLVEIIESNEVKRETIFDLYKVKDLTDLTPVQGKNIIENINKIKDKQEGK